MHILAIVGMRMTMWLCFMAVAELPMAMGVAVLVGMAMPVRMAVRMAMPMVRVVESHYSCISDLRAHPSYSLKERITTTYRQD